MTDKLLVRRIRDGDKSKEDELAEKYYMDVYRFCVYRTGSVLDAEDLTQETFLRLYRYFDSYDEMQKFKSYLLKIASNVCCDYLSGRHVNAVLDENIAVSQNENLSTDKLAVKRSVASLPDQMREIIVLYYYNNLKIADIAQMLDIPVSTVKTRLVRGRTKLKALLLNEGFR